MAEEIVDITGLDRGAVLAALYNNTHAPGLGVLHYSVAGMSVEEATELLEERWDEGMFRIGIEAYFDYLHGRVMKIAIPQTGNELNTWGYDRDNGEGAVAKIIADLRATGEVNSAETQTAHRKNQASANEDTLEATKIPTTSERVDKHIKLGIDELAPQVRAALVKAEEALIKADEDNN